MIVINVLLRTMTIMIMMASVIVSSVLGATNEYGEKSGELGGGGEKRSRLNSSVPWGKRTHEGMCARQNARQKEKTKSRSKQAYNSLVE